jgi:spermidine synthase
MNAPHVLQGMVSDSSIWINNLVNGLAGMSFKVKHSVFCEASPFQKVEVFDTYGYGRILMLAGSVVLTERDEFIYHEMITHPAMLMHAAPRRVCVIGGGDGGVAREVLKHDCVESVTVVEIDELVVKAARKHLPSLGESFDDPRTRVAIEDGCRYLEKNSESFDVILVDSYDPGGPVQSITSPPFYSLVAKRLGPKGIAVFQTDSPTLRSEYARAAIRELAREFAESRVYVCTIPSFPEGLCSFGLGVRDAVSLSHFDEKRCAKVADQCRCFSHEAHQGAFLLPKHVRDALSG